MYNIQLGFQGVESGKGPLKAETNTTEKQKSGFDVNNFEWAKKPKTPEEQEMLDKLDALEKKFAALTAETATKKKARDILLKHLKEDPSIQNDPEAAPTIALFKRYRKQAEDSIKQKSYVLDELNNLKKDLSSISTSLETAEYEGGVEYNEKSGKIEKMETSAEDLQAMKNIDFLKIPREQRLQHITKNHIDTNRVANGEIKNLEFTFTFDGVYNKELYLETTAGQVLPKEVGTVIAGGIEYSRSGLKGEFFNGNKRLTIHEGTKLEVVDVEGRDIDAMETKVLEKIEKIENKDEKLITKYAAERDLNAEMVMNTFKKIIEKLPEEEKVVKLESLFTQVERVRGDYLLDNNSTLLKDAIYDEDGDGNIDSYFKMNGKIDISNLELRGGEKGLLDLISVYESGGNYNAIYGNGNQSKVNFTEMTIGEVQAYQKRFVASGKPSSAIGKYQFISKTLKACADATGLGMNAKFSPENQDKMGLYLLKVRQLDSFMQGKISTQQFQLNLSKEWASLPKDMSEKSFYAGDGLNSAHLSSSQLRGYLEKMKRNGYGVDEDNGEVVQQKSLNNLKLDGLPKNNKKLLSLALESYKNKDIMGAKHCTDWVDIIYKKSLGASVYNFPKSFNGVKTISGGTGLGVREYASKSHIESIQAGNHIIVDKPRGGKYGIGRTHSVIALGKPENGLLKVVSYPNRGIPPRVEVYDLYGKGRGDKNGKPIRIQGINS